MIERVEWLLPVVFALCVLALIFLAFPVAVHDRSACQDALTAADARYQLAESTTALVFDQWRADNLGDAHGVEYAQAGIQTNQDEIDALTTDYNELKKECK